MITWRDSLHERNALEPAVGPEEQGHDGLHLYVLLNDWNQDLSDRTSAAEGSPTIITQQIDALCAVEHHMTEPVIRDTEGQPLSLNRPRTHWCDEL